MNFKRVHVEDFKRRPDEIIGLDVGGRIFYCHRSTLTNACGSYFAARFGEGSATAIGGDDDGSREVGCIPSGDVYVDDRGREVYFIDRDGELFEYVLCYLRTNQLPWKLPPFADNPMMWRGLRQEAEFYCLQAFSSLLEVTHVCNPDLGDRGILHWLGTGRGTTDYHNPHAIGAIHVGGWVDMPKDELIAQGLAHHMLDCAGTQSSREALVEYRPPARFGESNLVEPVNGTSICWCIDSKYRRPVTVDLRAVRLRPTHYSLRYGGCEGMTDWNFEASVDGTTWETLHEARGDTHLACPSEESMERLRELVKAVRDEEEEGKTILSFMEQHYRHTWTIDPTPSVFFRYVRLIGIGQEAWNALDVNFEEEPRRTPCLHGIGLELFGDVHER